MLTLSCSVGKAPIPTLVVYAFTTPYTSPTFCGGMPRPVQTPPTVQFDEVTNGYVPIKKKQEFKNHINTVCFYRFYKPNLVSITSTLQLPRYYNIQKIEKQKTTPYTKCILQSIRSDLISS